MIDELDETSVGDEPFCAGAAPWPEDNARHERAAVALLDSVRRSGIECDGVRRNPVAAPTVSPELHCAARLQATWIAYHGVTHDGAGDATPLSRANLAGYDGLPRFELLARNQPNALAVVNAWLSDPEHCAAIMDRDADEVGIGHSQTESGDASGWVLVLGEPRD